MVSALLASFSCTKQDVDGGGDKTALQVTASDLKIPAKGGSATIEFTEALQFEVTVDKAWCTASVEGSVVTLTAAENGSYESRYAGVTVKAGDASKDFTVQQFGYQSSGFEPKNIITTSNASSYDIPYEYGEELTVSTGADWVTLTVTGDNLNIALAENAAAGTPENPSRTAEIEWKLGKDSGVIEIVQNNVSFMEADDNWTVSYGGRQDYQGEPADIVNNDVADPDASGKYAMYYMPKAEFTACGSDMDDFALLVAQVLKEELETVVDFYQALGYDVSFADFLQEESGFEVFNPIDKGDYIGFAIGFTEDAVITGHYSEADFTVTGSGSGGGTATGYDAWLGEWTVTRGSSTDTWKIAKLKDGESYTVTGIEGFDFPVTALYESEKFVIYAQDGIATIELKSYGECPVGLFGGWGDEGDFSLGEYLICTGTLSGNTATLSPGTVSFSDGSSYKLDKMHFIATVTGGYGGISKDSTPLPTTLTKVGGGGDTPGGTGSEAYNRWIGNWNVDSGAFTISLTQNVADKSFDMRGWQMDEDFFEPAQVDFDAAKGTVTLYGNDDDPIASNVSVGQEKTACNLYLVGKFIYTDGDEYYITSAGEGAYDVATGTFQSDGSVKFTGNSFKLSGGGEFTFCRLEYMAISMSDPDIAYTFSSPDEFPLTAVKAGSTSSVKKNGAASRTGSWVRCSAKNIVKKADLKTVPQRTADVAEFCTPYPAVPEASAPFRRIVFIK